MRRKKIIEVQANWKLSEKSFNFAHNFFNTVNAEVHVRAHYHDSYRLRYYMAIRRFGDY